MRNYNQSASRVNQNIPAGHSQHRNKPKPKVTRDPYLMAQSWQFADESDAPRRAAHLRWLKRQVWRGFAIKGLSSTAKELSQFLNIPQRTVERTIRLLGLQGFLSDVRVLAVRDRHGKRLFKRARMLRKLNLQALLESNVAVCYGQCGGDTSTQASTTQEDSKQDSEHDTSWLAKPKSASHNAEVSNKTSEAIPRQPQERHFGATELLTRFAKLLEYSIAEADCRLGWIFYRAARRRSYYSEIGARIRNDWSYIVRANRNLDEQKAHWPGGIESFIQNHSFCETQRIPVPTYEPCQHVREAHAAFTANYGE